MTDSVNVVWPNNTFMTFNPATRRLELSYCFDTANRDIAAGYMAENVAQHISVVLDQDTIDILVAALTDGVRLAREKADRLAAEEKARQEGPERYPAFTVYRHENSDAIVRVTEYIHRRNCPLAPPSAQETTAQEVKTLVTRYAGNIMHLLDFCAKCFPRDYDNMGPDTFTSPVTDSGELRAVLDKLEADHIRAARITYAEQARTDDAEMAERLGATLSPEERAAVNEELDESVTLSV